MACWMMRLGALCAVVCAVACTGNPKPLPPNDALDGNMPPQDAMVADGNVQSDANVPPTDAAVDAYVPDGGADGGVEAGADGAVDGGEDGSVEGGTDAGDDAGPLHLDAGLFVPDGSLRRRDGGPVITPPPPRN